MRRYLGVETRISIFSGARERINLLMPWFFVPLVILEFLQFFDVLGWKRFTLKLLSGYVFLNASHIVFTFALILGAPELRRWLFAQLRRIQINSISLGVIFFFCLFIYGYLISSQFVFDSHLLRVITTSLILLQTQHALGQVKGLSSLYNIRAKRNHSYTPEELTKVLLLERAERFLFDFLRVMLWVQALVAPIWLHQKASLYPILYFNLVLVVGIVFVAALYPRAKNSNKLAYLWRVIFIPLVSFSSSAVYATGSFHGVEYLFVTEAAIKNSRRAQSLVLGLGVVGAMLFANFIQMDDVVANARLNDHVSGQWFYILIGAQFAIKYSHFYLDSIIFKFKNREVSDIMLPLLASK